MISVSEALDALFSCAEPLPPEIVDLLDSAGRVLAAPVTSNRDQPPFDASAMDGYAIQDGAAGARVTLIGESAAGHRFDGRVDPGQAVRIFTGAPVPPGATRVVPQEDVTRDGDTITLSCDTEVGQHIRPRGNDFPIGHVLSAPRRLTPAEIALIAAMNVPTVTVTRKPEVAIIATGDELVMPGDAPRPDQIIASNSFGLAAMLARAGARPRMLPIAGDTPQALAYTLTLAASADLILTIGGASVGDHDLVASVAGQAGLDLAFHKVAMRPGKPLLSGRLGGSMLIGLPGNPVSAMVCGQIFVLPVIEAMLGLPARPAPRETGILASPLAQNGPREHYMRASVRHDGLHVFDRQDSSLLSVLSSADALVVRPPHDPARPAGDTVPYVPILT